MTARTIGPVSWTERAADRSPLVTRSRARSIEQAKAMVDAARRLIVEKGARFTTQDLVKEAGVALQTFYRHFEGKDQLLLAVIEDTIAEAAVQFEAAAARLSDPLDRLRSYIEAALTSLHGSNEAAQFITAEHWRLHQLFPEEMVYATKPMTDLFLKEIRAATAQGLVNPADPERAAWMITKLTMAAFHHYAFAPHDDGAATLAGDVWAFCMAGLGSVRSPSSGVSGGRRRPARGTR
jgi:AcrR family transcriptional regulator